MTNNSPKEIVEVLLKSKDVLVNVDIRTDLDALCSARIVADFLKSNNIKYTVIHAKKISSRHLPYVNCSEYKEETDISTVDTSDFDLIVFLDSGTKGHVSIDENFIFPNIDTINIDHHSSNEGYGKYNYVQRIGSTCTLLFKMFEEVGIELNDAQLKLVITALITDTGFFKYDTMTETDFTICGKIASKGIKIHEIVNSLLGSESLDQIRFKELVYKNLVVDKKAKIAYTSYTKEDIRVRNIQLDKVVTKASDLIKYIEGINYVFALTQEDPDSKKVKVSFRTNVIGLNVCEIAEKLGGAGHIMAAAAVLNDVNSLDEALPIVLAQIPK